MSRLLVEVGGLVRFSHSIFALPFALMSAWLAARGLPPLSVLGLVVVCAVSARTAAMAFNRLVDRDIDARNPRTREREIPRGALSPGFVALLVALASAVFVGAAFALGPLCGKLSPAVLAVLFGYSYTKRFTWLAHGFLGLALGLAPLGAWLAVRGSFEGDLAPPLLLAGAVLSWVAGFDLIYACQDAGFDRSEGLRSFPARFGVARALGASKLLHAVTALLLVAFAVRAETGAFFAVALVAAGLLLVWEHSIVSPGDLSRVNAAFFTANGWMAVGLFLGLAGDLAWRTTG